MSQKPESLMKDFFFMLQRKKNVNPHIHDRRGKVAIGLLMKSFTGVFSSMYENQLNKFHNIRWIVTELCFFLRHWKICDTYLINKDILVIEISLDNNKCNNKKKLFKLHVRIWKRNTLNYSSNFEFEYNRLIICLLHF